MASVSRVAARLVTRRCGRRQFAVISVAASCSPPSSAASSSKPNLLDLGVMMAFWPAVMRRGGGWRPGRYWLREGEGEGDGGAEQFEGPGLDRGGRGELLDFLPGEADDL